MGEQVSTTDTHRNAPTEAAATTARIAVTADGARHVAAISRTVRSR